MSKNTLVLDNPINVNGAEIKELDYDAQEITVELYATACAKAASAGGSSVSMKVRETDYSVHMYLGMAAIIAVNPKIDFSDLERVKGFDLIDISNIGLLFTLRKSAEVSEESNSDEQSETIPPTSTQA